MGLSLTARSSSAEKAAPGLGKEDVLPLLLLSALCLVLFFFQLGAMPLWDVDEGMHAATSKEMVLTGDWITPKMNGENFYDKTPLFNWLVALSFGAFGFTEFPARLPAALLGLGTVLLTYLLGRSLFGPRSGMLGSVILATSPEFIVLSRAVVHDISLVFFMSGSLFFFYRAFMSERGRQLNLMLFYAAAGFAVLAKGPIGLFLPGAIIVLFLLLRGRLDFLKQISAARGTLVFLAVAAPWYVLISLRNSDYASYFFLKQNLGNFLSKAQARHPKPFYYYVPVLFAGMLPWSPLAPLAILRPLREGLKRIGDSTLFLLCWFAVIFFFFSAATSKLGTYMLPVFPALALLIGNVWMEMMSTDAGRLHRSIVWSLVPLPTVFLAATIYVTIAPHMHWLPYGMGSRGVALLAAVIALTLIAALLSFVFRRYAAAFWMLAATFVAAFLIFISFDVQGINPYRSTRSLAQEMDKMLPPGEPLVFFWRLRDSALFYTNRRAAVLTSKEQLVDYLTSDKKTLCVIERERYEAFPDVVRISRIIDQEGNKLLISGTEAGAITPR